MWVRVLSASLSTYSTLADSPVTIHRKWRTSRAISTLVMHSALYYAYFIFSYHFFYDLHMYLYNSTLSYSILLSSLLLPSLLSSSFYSLHFSFPVLSSSYLLFYPTLLFCPIFLLFDKSGPRRPCPVSKTSLSPPARPKPLCRHWP